VAIYSIQLKNLSHPTNSAGLEGWEEEGMIEGEGTDQQKFRLLV
jgi:hypothetical protein